ncbi:MAG: 6-carboxytetrahydropterin synthase [Armatimonadota bacterium]|nr:6-carboxytetrahydropterin synthase [Armatimonadota bacterium]MDR7428221.1 6-carboxytetrahydropterin synthase [Armatimonadota bacterium]MDR7470719.1 6-carboxytetrahydropterin synthase [Armatimonadota bacterium]MDR7475756.1 6-carboxytetrahydropterin synthase [Armatimonadota bacterium]MDR7540509.1 6-carboxytetrahydropterin synthase [Armatimonadota bacterium]
MFEIGVSAEFSATHRLRGDFGAATQPHGHAYRVDVVVRGPALGPDGTLLDVEALRRLLDDALAPLAGRDLDTVPGLCGLNTTAEVVARHLFHALREGLLRLGDSAGGRLRALRVTVWESPEVWAGCEGPLRNPAE